MKKILLTIMCLLGIQSAWAEQFTYTPIDANKLNTLIKYEWHTASQNAFANVNLPKFNSLFTNPYDHVIAFQPACTPFERDLKLSFYKTILEYKDKHYIISSLYKVNNDSMANCTSASHITISTPPPSGFVDLQTASVGEVNGYTCKLDAAQRNVTCTKST